MAIIVTLPIEAPTNISTSIVEGGSLEANTTYYYVMFASERYTTPSNYLRFGNHSPISEEGSITTTTTGKSIKFNWTDSVYTDISGYGIYYQILLTKVSGDYAGARTYGTLLEEMNTNISDGNTGYTVTNIDTSDAYMKHSIQSTNSLIGGITNESGIIDITLDDTDNTTYTGAALYNAVVAAGYSDNIYFDGYNFYLKGWIRLEGSHIGTGAIYFEGVNLVFIKGGIHNWSTTRDIRFGRWVDDIQGGNAYYATRIDLQSGRYNFRGYYDTFKVYSSAITSAQSRQVANVEIVNPGYYNAGYGTFISYNVSEVKDNIMGVSLRNTRGDIKDLKFGQGNNFASDNHIRCEIFGYANMPYYQGGKFYACNFVANDVFRTYSIGSFATTGYYSDFYDCKFPRLENGEVQIGDFYYSIYVLGETVSSDQYYDFNYSIKFDVLNELGEGIEGVTVNCRDKNGNPIEWEEKDGTYDELVTGVTTTGSVETDISGSVDYYTKSYRFTMPDYTGSASGTYQNYYLTKTTYYPFTLTFSKDGYRDYTIVQKTMNDKVQGVITLEYTEDPTIEINGGNFYGLEINT